MPSEDHGGAPDDTGHNLCGADDAAGSAPHTAKRGPCVGKKAAFWFGPAFCKTFAAWLRKDGAG